MILAGDIGGTHTRLALFDEQLNRQQLHVFDSKDYQSLEEPLAAFVGQAGTRVNGACFGVAGPVVKGVVKTTNLPWTVEIARLARELQLPDSRVHLINDLQVNASGIALLREDDVITLNEGESKDGNRAIIAAGTGLGEAGLYWDGHTHRPVASEGGHASFGPTDEIQDRLLTYLRSRERARFRGHVSWERLLSGQGLVNVFQFLVHARIGKASVAVARELKSNPSPAAISQAALKGSCERCSRALELFVTLYGAEAGNLALKFLAIGGLYVGGGIAPKIVPALCRPHFIKAFREKGPMKKLLERIPVRVILNDQTALLGAARTAVEMG